MGLYATELQFTMKAVLMIEYFEKCIASRATDRIHLSRFARMHETDETDEGHATSLRHAVHTLPQALQPLHSGFVWEKQAIHMPRARIPYELHCGHGL